MEVSRYIFQSPYSSQVQIGRPDTSVKQENDSSKSGDGFIKNTNQTLQNAESFNKTQVKDVAPVVSSKNSLLDLYA